MRKVVLIFATVLPSLLLSFFWCLFWRKKQGVPRTILEVFVQGKFMGYWSTSNLRSSLPSAMFLLFASLLRLSTANRKRRIQICYETCCSFSGNTSSKTKICWKTILLGNKLVTNVVICATGGGGGGCVFQLCFNLCYVFQLFSQQCRGRKVKKNLAHITGP